MRWPKLNLKQYKHMLLPMVLMANLLLFFYLMTLRSRLDYTEVDMERFFEHVSFNPKAYDPIRWPQDVNIRRIRELTSSAQTLPLRPINKPNFKYIIPNSEKCRKLAQSGQSDFTMLMMIKSAPQHFDRRQGIRKTWGNESCWGPVQVVRLFMLGAVAETDPKWQQTIETEYSIYGDLIQQNFSDTYYNVTYKTMMGIQWAVQYCSKAQMIMFVDDDFFVYPEKNVRILKQFRPYFSTSLIAGKFLPHSKPLRLRSSKWFIDVDEYPFDYYPPYFHAGHYYVTMHLAREIRTAMWYTKHIRFDDVYLGLILTKLAYNRADIKSIRIQYPMTFSLINRYASVHAYKTPDDQMYSWQKLDCQSFCRTIS